MVQLGAVLAEIVEGVAEVLVETRVAARAEAVVKLAVEELDPARVTAEGDLELTAAVVMLDPVGDLAGIGTAEVAAENSSS